MSTKEAKVSSDTPDLESAPEKLQRPTSPLQVLEAAALLTLWSILVINEGAIRFIGSVPSDLGRQVEAGQISPYLLFFGGLAEVIFGLFGLFVGFSAFILRSYSTLITKACMLTQSILGWFVFIVYVFVVPAVGAANLDKPLLAGLSIGSSKFVITLGILTSSHFCLALQGGQFLFMARLVAAATGDDFLKQNSGNRMRAMFWNGNFALSGLWTLITGAIIRAQVGSGELAETYISPPNVGRLPGLTVAVGLVMLVWGIVGIGMAVAKTTPSFYFIGTGIVYILALLNFGILQFGIFGDRTAGGPIAMHNGLVFMVVFLGPYFVLKAVKEDEESA